MPDVSAAVRVEGLPAVRVEGLPAGRVKERI